MGSGTSELFVRHGGYGAVLQTGPVSGFGSCVKEVRAPRSCGRIDGKPHRVRWPHGPGTSGALRVSGQQQEGGTGRGGGRCSRWKAERESGRHDAGRVSNPSGRSEEHTSELQSLMRNSYAVFCLKTKNKR